MRPARGLQGERGSRRANWSAGYERWWSSEPPVQGDGAGHETGRVEREHRRAAIAREALARGEQGARDAVPARVGVDGERAPAGPAGRPPEPLDRSVRVERPEPADPA